MHDLLLLEISLLLVLGLLSVNANLIDDPSFEYFHLGRWKLRQRQSLWDLTPITTNQDGDIAAEISTKQSHLGNHSLMFTTLGTSDEKRMPFTTWAIATQFVKISKQISTKGIHARYSHWYTGNNNCWKLILHLRYKDDSYHQVEYDGSKIATKTNQDDHDGTFQQFCLNIPIHNVIRFVMVSILSKLENSSQCHGNLYVDDIALEFINIIQDLKPLCQIYDSTFPVYRHRLKRYRISDFTLNKRAKKTGTYITVATQMTIDRLSQLEKLVQIWQGPVSVAVLIYANIASNTSQNQLSILLRKYNEEYIFKKYVDIHVVFEDTLNGKDKYRYPANYLRNIAIKKSKTSHVYLLDVDILPSCSHDEAVAAITKASSEINLAQNGSNICQKCAFITPLFKVQTQAQDFKIPTSKNSLMEELQKENPSIQPMGVVSHSMTSFGLWYSSTSAYKTNYKKDNEPYFIINRKLSPNINNIFTGYGRDKCAYAREVNIAGFAFFVLPTTFTIDMPNDANVGIAGRNVQFGSILPIDVFLNMEFHDGEMEEKYGRNFKAKNDVTVITATTTTNNKNGTSAKQEKKVKDKKKRKTDMSGFGCKDAIIEVVEDAAVSSSAQHVIVERMVAMYGVFSLVEFYAGGKYSIYNVMSHLKSNVILILDESEHSTNVVNHVTKEIYGQNLTVLVKQVKLEIDDPILFWIPTEGRSQSDIETALNVSLLYVSSKDIIIIEDGRQEFLLRYKDLMCAYKNKWRIKVQQTVTVLKSSKLIRKPVQLPVLPRIAELTERPLCQNISFITELVLFTRNRPMQTLSFVQSLCQMTSGLDKIWILYRADTLNFQQGYDFVVKCLRNFTKIGIEAVKEKPGEFGQKLLDILEHSHANYFVYAVDEIIWIKPANFKYIACQLHVANGEIASFQLRLGENVRSVRYPEEYEKYSQQVLPLNYDPEIVLLYPLTLPYDHGYVIHVDGILMHRSQLLNDSRTFLANIKNPMGLENYWLWNKLTDRCRQWHLSYSSSRLVNNLLGDGRVLDQIVPSEESEQLLKVLMAEEKQVDIVDIRQRLLNHRTTHTQMQVKYVAIQCNSMT